MANPNFDKDRASKILLDAVTMGDVAAAKKWGVTVQTIVRYRKRLDTDPDFLAALGRYKTMQDESWANEIPLMLEAGIRFLKEASEVASRTDPDSIGAIATAVKTIAEIEMMRRVVDARIGENSINS